MHDVVIKELEEHLTGEASPAVQAHLASCGSCRAEVALLADVSGLLAEFRSVAEADIEPSPFFYKRVTAGIAECENKASWRLLSPGAAFFRRVAFASLLLLGCLGSYLAVRENNSTGTDAVTIMAQHEVIASHPEGADRNLMLVTLASYQQ